MSTLRLCGFRQANKAKTFWYTLLICMDKLCSSFPTIFCSRRQAFSAKWDTTLKVVQVSGSLSMHYTTRFQMGRIVVYRCKFRLSISPTSANSLSRRHDGTRFPNNDCISYIRCIHTRIKSLCSIKYEILFLTIFRVPVTFQNSFQLSMPGPISTGSANICKLFLKSS